MNEVKIGWVGLGTMGMPMARQLMKAGYLVSAYNRSQEKVNALVLQGAHEALSPEELLRNTDVIFVMVSDDVAIQEIFGGNEGLLKAHVSGKIIINMSTVSPKISEKLAVLCQNQGNSYLDAPVSGSVKQALEGQLVIMVGGDETVYEKVKPILEHLGKLSLWIGPNGAGNRAKLAMNTLLGLYAQGLAESVLFANSKGIRTEDLMALINNSALGNVFTRIKGDAIMAEDYQAAFALKHIAKDLRLAKAEGMSGRLAKVSYDTFQKAEAEFGQEDIIAVLKYSQKTDKK